MLFCSHSSRHTQYILVPRLRMLDLGHPIAKDGHEAQSGVISPLVKYFVYSSRPSMESCTDRKESPIASLPISLPLLLKEEHLPSHCWTRDPVVSKLPARSACGLEERARGGEACCTYRVVFQHAHGRRRPRAGELVEEARHGHGEQSHRDDAGLGC